MTDPRPSDLQRAVNFLSSADLLNTSCALPDGPDYAALTQHARNLGRDVTPHAIRCAFQLIMRARLMSERMHRPPDALR